MQRFSGMDSLTAGILLGLSCETINISASAYVSHVVIYSCVYYNVYYNTSLIPDVVKRPTLVLLFR